MEMKAAGYSGTPLAKKLGLKSGFRIKIVNPPAYYFNLFTDLPADIVAVEDTAVKKDFIHYFSRQAAILAEDIKTLKREMKEEGMIWISWPKKASGLETDLNGNLVRTIGLAQGLVDIKVCAVDEVWSGLKFVVPLKDRRR